MPQKPSWGAIFDFDGVIVDSSKQHEESWQILARDSQLKLPADFFKRSFGMKNEKIIPEILEWTQEPNEITQFSLRKEELYRDLLKKDGIQCLPGVYKTLKMLRGLDVPRIVASSSHRLNITTALSVLNLEEYFPSIVCSEDVTLGKPNPQVFLKAAEKINVPPTRCVVFEDAMVGVEAAKAAAMKVVALTTTHERKYFNDADLIIENLDHISLSQLEIFFA
jgi:beta-phosphoglucomutase family hydrolase